MNITLTSTDISCGHCKATIEGDLAPREGVNHVEVTPADKSIAIDFDDAVISEADLRAIIEDLGYDLS